MKTALVRDWMTPNPVTVSPELSLPDALQRMKAHNIRRLLVVDRGRLVGIVTRGDLRGAQPSDATSLSIFELHYLVGRITLAEIMTRDPLTVSPTTTLQDAARLMLQHKVAGLPVVSGGQVVGIITESDIFRLVVKTWEQEDAPVPA